MIEEESIKDELKMYGLSPNKFLGQHFLRDEEIVKKMINSVELNSINTIIEVGPGLGILTTSLANTGKKIIAIEKDREIAAMLKNKFKGVKNVNILPADILTCNIEKIIKPGEPYAVVANLPYNITARFLKQFLSGMARKPKEIVVMIQKEVAERMTSPPGRLTKLGLLSQIYGDTKIVIDSIGKESFVPPPKVLSAVIRSVIKERPLSLFPQHEEVFWRLVRIGFSSKRKMLANNLSAGLKITSKVAKEMLTLARIDPSSRAEDLIYNDFLPICQPILPTLL